MKIPNKLVTKYKTTEETIGHLPKLKAGEINKSDPLHRSSKLSELNLKRIRASKPGGTWKDWPRELLPECYKRPSGASFTAVYGRIRGDVPSNTLTTQFNKFGTGRNGHYDQDRGLSLREGALLQTFPKDYDFNIEGLSLTAVAMHIGNAVPPIAGEIIGKIFINML